MVYTCNPSTSLLKAEVQEFKLIFSKPDNLRPTWPISDFSFKNNNSLNLE